MTTRYVEFVETEVFRETFAAVGTDVELRGLQQALCLNPEAGNVIPGAHGARKVRLAAKGKGKRGGARIIYYRKVSAERVYLLFAYAKGVKEKLTPAEAKAVGEAVKTLK